VPRRGVALLGDFLENQDTLHEMMKGPRMDTYADLIFFVGWPDTGALMRRPDDGKTQGWQAGQYVSIPGGDGRGRQKNFGVFKSWRAKKPGLTNAGMPRGYARG